ncbi:MAG: ribose-phosphate pyrophosphokinase [Patescibacteria group bacterium]|nr:ribose-phosphate pyrophosphokinase [Patescibacteria group bacterium]
MNKKSFIIGGSSNIEFARKLSLKAKIPLGKVIIGRFSNGEAKVRIEEQIYGNTFYVIQSLTMPVDEHIMELCLLVDALKRGGAEKIVAVVPWFGYGVQDKVFMTGEALSSKVVIGFLQSVGIHSLVTVDLHSDNIIGFFEVPVVHVTAIPLFAQYIKRKYGKNVLIVSPDFGGAKRARRFAKELGQTGTIGIVDKERSLINGSLTLRGINLAVSGKVVVLPDDFISTGGTLLEVTKLLAQKKPKKVICCISHSLLVNQSAKKLAESPISELVTTDSVEIPVEKRQLFGKKLSIISTVGLITPYLKV